MATRYGISPNYSGLFAMLEFYNPHTDTFFTPVGELGFALHEMFEISGLSFGELPYEEFVPGSRELEILKNGAPEIYDTYWELMCHFQICARITEKRASSLKQGQWAEYLFRNLWDKEAEVTRLAASTLEEITERINDVTSQYTCEAEEDVFPAFTTFESFHYQAEVPISDMALFAGFLTLWLKRCVVPTRPVDAITVEVLYPAVLLAYGRPLNLLLAMVCCLQSGLRELSSEFIAVKKLDSDGKTVI
uniref:Aminotransferase-like plant mobile domain-containing protein n=1 Tax=Asparagus officinalis TaxID=4686 RepID=Q2XNV6_ASPOF|nr:hypothetical protein 12.t00027 [Asparagus officinalis]